METKLEKIVSKHPKYQELSADADRKEKQAVLDLITEEVMGQLTPKEVSEHVRIVYNETIEEYVKNTHNQGITDDLVTFMSAVLGDGVVLDIGCGTGRDALFMSCADREFRASLMQRESGGEKTIKKYLIPESAYKVIGIDGSVSMIREAVKWEEKIITEGKMWDAHSAVFMLCLDMHRLNEHNQLWKAKFDGVWSCAALFTHTPKDLVRPALQSIASIMKPSGCFATSYTNGALGERYDKILASSTGRLKYFSHPDPKEITVVAAEYGLKLVTEKFNDFEVNGKVIQKDLFVSQFYRKE